LPPAKIALSDVRVLFTAAEIAARVDALAAKIVRTIPNDFVMVGLLKGAAVFVADLARAGARPEIEFMRLSSYGLAKREQRRGAASGRYPRRPRRPPGAARRRHRRLPADRSPTPLPNCATAGSAISGPARCSTSASGGRSRSRSILSASRSPTCSWWGYGTDFAERYRHLPFIGVVE